MKKTILIITVIAMSFTSKLFAQGDAEMKAWQTYMTPGEVHKMLAKSSGDWDLEVTMWMDPKAAPSKSNSTCKTEMIMGDRYQMSKVSGDMMGMPFEGMSLVGYDNAKKTFSSTWIDNMGTGTMHLEGTWDDKTKTLTSKGKCVNPGTGKDQNVRETLQIVDENTHKMEMFTSMNGKEFKTMEIVYKRKM